MVDPEPPQVGADRLRVRHQRGRRLRVAADRRPARAIDVRLFQPDRVARVAQPVGMVDVDAGDDGDIGVDHVDGVEASAQAYLEDGEEARAGGDAEEGVGALDAALVQPAGEGAMARSWSAGERSP